MRSIHGCSHRCAQRDGISLGATDASARGSVRAHLARILRRSLSYIALPGRSAHGDALIESVLSPPPDRRDVSEGLALPGERASMKSGCCAVSPDRLLRGSL